MATTTTSRTPKTETPIATLPEGTVALPTSERPRAGRSNALEYLAGQPREALVRSFAQVAATAPFAWRGRKATDMTVNDGCSVDTPTGYRCARLVPSDALWAWIVANMLDIEHDVIAFKVIAHSDQTASLYAVHSKIIASRRLRTFKADELPLAVRAVFFREASE